MVENPSTTNPECLLALADRCEREEANLNLKVALALALGWREIEHDCAIRYIDPSGRMWWIVEAPDWLRSLDAAADLVPEGAWKTIAGPLKYLNIPSPSPNYWRCEIATWDPTREARGWGATEALATCAAALRARAALSKATEGR